MATVTIPLHVYHATPGSSAIPALVNTAGTNAPVPGWSFTIASSHALYFDIPKLPNYGSGNISFGIEWYASGGQTTGNSRWDVQMMATTPGDAQSLETDAFATATNTTTTVNGTARGHTETVVTVSNLDSVAAGDRVVFKLVCNSAGTLGSNPIAVGFYISYSDT